MHSVMKLQNLYRYLTNLSLLLVLLLPAHQVSAQTADEIVSKNIEALGGKDKLNSLHTLYLEGVSVMANGNEIDSKIWRVKDQLFRQEISFGMGNVVIVVTPKQGWKSNPRNGGNFEAIPDEQLKAMQMQLDLSGPLVDYAAKGNTLELLGRDTINTSPCYKIRLSGQSGQSIIYYIDASTYYILRETRKGSGMFGGRRRGNGGTDGTAANADPTYNIDYSDYQKTPEGFILPYSMVIGGGAKTSFEKIEVNKPVDEAKLSKPENQ